MQAREQQFNGGESRTIHEGRSGREQGTKQELEQELEQGLKGMASDPFMWAAAASVIGSATLYLTGNKRAGLFVGQWAPTLLVLGTYKKMVKMYGSD